MATSLSSRAATSPSQTLGLFRLSFNFLRSLSTSSPSTKNPSATSTDSNKRRRRKKKNLFEVAQFLPNWGLGYHMAKTHWTGVSYEITKINLYKVFSLSHSHVSFPLCFGCYFCLLLCLFGFWGNFGIGKKFTTSLFWFLVIFSKFCEGLELGDWL